MFFRREIKGILQRIYIARGTSFIEQFFYRAEFISLLIKWFNQADSWLHCPSSHHCNYCT